MPLARWKVVCIDTTGGEALGRFWAAAIGADFRPDGRAGDVVARGDAAPGGSMAMCTVPEAKTVKHRVHLDVYTAAVADLEAHGARVLLHAEETGLGWSVMADPEDGEFCAFLRDPAELPSYRCHGLVVDAADPEAACRWWGEALGVTPDDNGGRGFWTLTGIPGNTITTMDFVPVPEPKTVKNRIHWDVYGDPDELVAAGATLLRRRDEEIGWHVLADPEGNEFCVFEGN